MTDLEPVSVPPLRDPALRAVCADALVERARDAAHRSDFETLTDCVAEVAARSRRRPVRRAIEAAAESGAEPLPWLDRAREAARAVTRSTRGTHHLYVALVDGYARGGRFGVYVGESRYRPENRFAQHRAGLRAARTAGRMVALLPSLTAHLNPLSRAEAKALERELADALRAAGLRVSGGH
jgi:hypothetical protein